MSRGTKNLPLAKYSVNKCFIIPNNIRDELIAMLFFVVVCRFQDFSLAYRKNPENSEFHYHISTNESTGLSILRKYILSPVYSTGEGNSLLDYSLLNYSLQNLPVNRIFMCTSFQQEILY